MSDENKLGAILCPNCRKLISANSKECTYCGMKNPNLWGFSGMLQNLFGGQMSLIPLLSAVCVTVFIISLLVDAKGIRVGGLDIIGPSIPSLFRLGATGTFAINEGKWWSVITAIYLHGGLLHIFFNVYWIRQLGPPLEEFYGISRSFIIFTVAGILGFMVSNFMGIPLTIGASGSNFGLLGALIYYGKKRGGTFGLAIYRQVGQWAVVLFIIGFILPGVNNYAHAGGFAGGVAAAAILGFAEIKQENRRHHLLALSAIGLTAFAFLMVLFSFF